MEKLQFGLEKVWWSDPIKFRGQKCYILKEEKLQENAPKFYCKVLLSEGVLNQTFTQCASSLLNELTPKLSQLSLNSSLHNFLLTRTIVSRNTQLVQMRETKDANFQWLVLALEMWLGVGSNLQVKAWCVFDRKLWEHFKETGTKWYKGHLKTMVRWSCVTKKADFTNEPVRTKNLIQNWVVRTRKLHPISNSCKRLTEVTCHTLLHGRSPLANHCPMPKSRFEEG